MLCFGKSILQQAVKILDVAAYRLPRWITVRNAWQCTNTQVTLCYIMLRSFNVSLQPSMLADFSKCIIVLDNCRQLLKIFKVQWGFGWPKTNICCYHWLIKLDSTPWQIEHWIGPYGDEDEVGEDEVDDVEGEIDDEVVVNEDDED